MPPKNIAANGKGSKLGTNNGEKVGSDDKNEEVNPEQAERLKVLLHELELVKKENDRLRRQQEDTFGVTIDSVDKMKRDLERARTTRHFLMEDIAARKTQSERLEADIFELKMKLESYTRKINELNKMKEEWEETSERLVRSREKCERLSKANKNLRALLSKNNIDPKLADPDLDKNNKKSSKTDRTEAKPFTKSMADRRKRNDSHSITQANSVRGKKKSSSWADYTDSETVLDEGVNRRSAVESRKVYGRGSPSYLGYYSDIYQSRLASRSKYDGVFLPKLVIA